MLQFFGQMLGVSLRSGIPMALNMMPTFWRSLVSDPLVDWAESRDLDPVTFNYISSLQSLTQITAQTFLEENDFPKFTFHSLTGEIIELRPGGFHISVDFENKEECAQNFCLHVPAGGTLGIVGATGSGKSTLVKLLLRLYPMQGGKITLDGLLIDSIRLQDLRRCIALVSQEVYLFEGTIAENIAYGNAYAGAAAVRKAAVLAEAVEFIEQLPQGFDTLVGERGQRLSGGQRQRIALARAIIKQAPVLILDEATAAVDNETEAAIQRSLKHINYGRTTLIIAHRLSTVQHADQIIVMEHGQITEKGAHNQLIHSNGTYAKLWRAQADPHFLGMVKPQS